MINFLTTHSKLPMPANHGFKLNKIFVGRKSGELVQVAIAKDKRFHYFG
jgi:hypothetical protein